jgi:hypothetical protein
VLRRSRPSASPSAPHHRPRAEEVGRPPTGTKGGARRAREEELGGAACVRARRSSGEQPAYARGGARRRTARARRHVKRSSSPPDSSRLHYLLHSPFFPSCRVIAPGTFLSLRRCRSTTPSADAHRQPPPVAHPPILGLECVPLILRMLPDLYSLVRTSPPTRNGRVKPVAD